MSGPLSLVWRVQIFPWLGWERLWVGFLKECFTSFGA